MKTIGPSLLIIATLLAAGCGNKSSTPAATNTATRFDTGNPLTAPVDYIGAVNQAKKYSEKQIDIAYVTQAIGLFQAGEGRYPKSIDELVQEHYLGKYPDLPPGYQLNYDPNTGALKVTRK